jgi:hydrogenase maturation factor HypE
MAKEEYISLESIFDTANVIEEGVISSYLKQKIKQKVDPAITKIRAIKNNVMTNATLLNDKLKAKTAAVGNHLKTNKNAYKAGIGSGLLGWGLGTAGLYHLHNQLADVVDNNTEAMHTLSDKLADVTGEHYHLL